MDKFCVRCGGLLSQDGKVCTSCGASVKEEPATSIITGEATTSSAEPLKFLLNGALGISKGLKNVLRNKKKLIPAVIMAVLWFVLSLLPLLGINSLPVKLLGYLSFAKGGTNAGVLGALGGTIGKGIFAYFISSMFLPVFSGKKSLSKISGTVKQLFSSLAVKDSKAFTPLLSGMGVALISYNFLTGNASIQNSMIGITAFLLSLRALSSKAGFLRGFISSFIKKFSKANTLNADYVKRTIGGMTSGYALSLLLSFTKIPVIGYLTGIVFLVAAIFVMILTNRRKEVAPE